MFNMGEVVEIAVQLEKNGAETYENAAKRVSNEAVARVLNELAEDETRHAKWFIQLGKHLGETSEVSPELENVGKGLLKNVVENQAFSLQETDFSSVDKLEDVLSVAVSFEEDTVLFYQMLGAFIGDEETIEQLEGIIEEEKKHISLLQERLLQLAS